MKKKKQQRGVVKEVRAKFFTQQSRGTGEWFVIAREPMGWDDSQAIVASFLGVRASERAKEMALRLNVVVSRGPQLEQAPIRVLPAVAIVHGRR